jgi:hypothetical protein
MFCDECGAQFVADAPSPGLAVPADTRFCEECHAIVVGAFCQKCGHAAGGATPASGSISSGEEAGADDDVRESPASFAHEDAALPPREWEGEKRTPPCESWAHIHAEEEGKLGEGDLHDVCVEILTHDEWWAGEDCYLSFRLTNLTRKAFTATVSAEVERAEALGKTKATHHITPLEENVMFRIGFVAERAGQKKVNNLRLTLKAKDAPDGSKCYRVPDDSIVIRVQSKDSGASPSLEINSPVIIKPEECVIDKMDIHVGGQRQQQGKDPGDWQAIRLIFDAEETQKEIDGIRGKGEPEFVEQPPRIGLQEAKLVFDDGMCVRKFFLFAKQSIYFGKNPQATDGSKNEVAWRVFADQTTDRDKTNKISRRHGALYLRQDGVEYEDFSAHGTFIEDKKVCKGREPLPEMCTLNPAGVLRMEVRTFHAKSSERLVIKRNYAMLPHESHRAARCIGMENAGEVDAVRLRRKDDAHHEYIVLARQALVGSNEGDPIRIEGEGVEEIHAKILYYNGEFLIRGETHSSPTAVNGQILEPEQYCPLAPGKIIALGKTEIRFEEIKPEDFKQA